ncbi:hypothetical protein PV410_12450 [Streptomyces sp. PA03-5A]|nr:hypothetical protein [Streptomyces sp. PA03-5A]
MTDPDDLLREAVIRATALGWRTLSVRRLQRLAAGDRTALPPDQRPARRPRP